MYRSTLRNVFTNVIRTVIPRNRCVRIICTQSHKIATFEAMQIYDSEQTVEAECVPKYGFVAYSVNQCVVVKLIRC